MIGGGEGTGGGGRCLCLTCSSSSSLAESRLWSCLHGQQGWLGPCCAALVLFPDVPTRVSSWCLTLPLIGTSFLANSFTCVSLVCLPHPLLWWLSLSTHPPELALSSCFAAKPLGGPQEELHQTVLQHSG